ncbi:LCP family protein [Brevibacillus fulvus]|uniref:LCP family protein required for cell wall assembly n=1 Tax=Brevibacillus fulvus TaxID=1125967 RepID=A0A938XS33_9BACL|nr:LCP family protein [Brevibacillus fulvus]MBM7588892.1 LCP family protein required for cell wall assembly [Brevibacillus fulvus]
MKRLLKIAMMVLFVAACGSAWWFYHMFQHVKATAEQMYEPLPAPKPAPGPVPRNPAPMPQPAATSQPKPLLILLYGVDQRHQAGGRTDTLILLALNPAKRQSMMLSIPRDTRTEIFAQAKQDKINHAYQYGGNAATVRTVEQFLNISIDYFIQVNMEGFARVLDSVGPIQVDNPFAFSYEGHHFPQGRIELDGEAALAFVRMRYDDPEGDFGRNKRQQQVIRELMNKGKQIGTISKLDEMLAQVGSSFKTNLTWENMQDLMLHYKPALDQVDAEKISGKGEMINGIYYFVVSERERQRLKNTIEQYLAPTPDSSAATGIARPLEQSSRPAATN